MSQGYFKQEGLNLQVTVFPSGKRALVDGLLTDRVDYITTTGVPFVWKSFEHDDLSILASIYRADNVNRIVARRDAGIETISDLKGKHLATQKQSAVHYFLHSILTGNQIDHNSVRLSFFKAEELAPMLKAGKIDAFSMREPFISQAVDLLGEDNAVVLQSPGLYLQNELLVSRRALIDADSSVAPALLRALIKAEAFANEHSDRAIEIVTAAIDADEMYIRSLWKSFALVVDLQHSMLVRLEETATWMLKEDMVAKRRLPDFHRRTYSDALKSVKPYSVMLIL